jgi:hypothetical protein
MTSNNVPLSTTTTEFYDLMLFPKYCLLAVNLYYYAKCETIYFLLCSETCNEFGFTFLIFHHL